jgi:hypothetical protein
MIAGRKTQEVTQRRVRGTVRLFSGHLFLSFT